MSIHANQLIEHLYALEALQAEAGREGLNEQIQQLQSWQCKRLLASHHDMRSNHCYKNAIYFFVEELYGPHNFDQRNNEVARVLPKAVKLLPNEALQCIDDALKLNTLSFEMDIAMVKQIDKHPIDRFSYATSYRHMGRSKDRYRQLELLQALGDHLENLVKFPGIKWLLKLTYKPAKLAGLLSLFSFLERGYHTFNQVDNINEFVTTLITRETQLNNALLDPSINLTTHNPLPHV